jgi:hypothetical protein
MEFDHIGGWGVPEIAAYLAAMNAERHSRADAQLSAALDLDELRFGGGRWYRPMSWFSDPGGPRPEWHVRYPFADRTLRRGFWRFGRSGLVLAEWITHDPRDGHQFPNGRRVLYHNGFDDLRSTVAHRRNRLRGRQLAAASLRRQRLDHMSAAANA